MDWQSTPPDKTGDWEIKSFETDGEPSVVRIFDNKGTLWVDCPDLGKYPISYYHDGLTRPQWRAA